jgi:hypothetical protein
MRSQKDSLGVPVDRLDEISTTIRDSPAAEFLTKLISSLDAISANRHWESGSPNRTNPSNLAARPWFLRVRGRASR